MLIRGKDFNLNEKTLIMGIVNATPDSFSDGGMHFKPDEAAAFALKLVDEGADIIDVGGESTRPGFTPVSPDEELSRVIPVIKEIREKSDVPISVDTTKSEVLKAAVEAGADILNDVSGFMLDKNMGKAAALLNIPVILCHDGFYFNDLKPGEETGNLSLLMPKSLDPGLYIREVIAELKLLADGAMLDGVAPDKIILDPGIGFGKTLKQNLILLDKMGMLKDAGYPLLLGCSRKSVIGRCLDLPANERVEGTITTSVLGALNGISILRVHDVKENLRAVRMLEAIRKGGEV